MPLCPQDVYKRQGFYQREFGFYSLEKWRERDGLDESADLNKLFGFDPEGRAELFGLGWCEAGFQPVFETKVLEDLSLIHI